MAAYVDAEFEVSPTLVNLFGAGSSQDITVSNIGNINGSGLILNFGPLHNFVGMGAEVAACTTGGVRVDTLNPGESCTATIAFEDVTAPLQTLQFDVDHPFHETVNPAVRLVGTGEGIFQEARRRLPPVVQDITLSTGGVVVDTNTTALIPGTTYDIEVQVLGYGEEFALQAFSFACDVEVDGSIIDDTCAPNTNMMMNPTLIDGPLTDGDGATASVGGFTFSGTTSTLYNYSISYEVPAGFDITQDLVLRFFYATPDDFAATGIGTSLLVPGGLDLGTVGEQGRKIRFDVN